MIEDHCLVDAPITIGNDDVLTEVTALQIESHNFAYERYCTND